MGEQHIGLIYLETLTEQRLTSFRGLNFVMNLSKSILGHKIDDNSFFNVTETLVTYRYRVSKKYVPFIQYNTTKLKLLDSLLQEVVHTASCVSSFRYKLVL